MSILKKLLSVVKFTAFKLGGIVYPYRLHFYRIFGFLLDAYTFVFARVSIRSIERNLREFGNFTSFYYYYIFSSYDQIIHMLAYLVLSIVFTTIPFIVGDGFLVGKIQSILCYLHLYFEDPTISTSTHQENYVNSIQYFVNQTGSSDSLRNLIEQTQKIKLDQFPINYSLEEMEQLRKNLRPLLNSWEDFKEQAIEEDRRDFYCLGKYCLFAFMVLLSHSLRLWLLYSVPEIILDLDSPMESMSSASDDPSSLTTVESPVSE